MEPCATFEIRHWRGCDRRFPGKRKKTQATLALVEKLPLTYLHVFSFSVRPGTPAAELPYQVPDSVIDRRATELRALGEKKKAAFQVDQLGARTRVLTLKRSGVDTAGPLTLGLISNYLNVRVGGTHPPNQFLRVRVTRLREGQLIGDLRQARSYSLR